LAKCAGDFSLWSYGNESVEMSDNSKIQPSIEMLRVKVAVNHFKRLLLGDMHIPGKAQEISTFEELEKDHDAVEISGRAWSNWFSNPDVVPKVDKVKELDRLASASIRLDSKNGLKDKHLPANSFYHMIHGGLVSKMKSSRSKQPLIAMKDRAENYRPDSALHLHLDAVEVCALSVGHGDIPWETVKKIGAETILRLLAEKWGPRGGSVYSELSSDLRLEWNAASTEKRASIRKSYARLVPDVFDRHLDTSAIPDWGITGIDNDISALHIYKALFCLAADSEFLVADRLEAWSLDLATAALAMHALAWTDRYTTFLISDELFFWSAFDSLFFRFSTEAIDSGNHEILEAMNRCNAEWGLDSFDVFSHARKIYHEELIQLGISVNDVNELAMRATKIHPLVYRGG
jgi:hypothetical protein